MRNKSSDSKHDSEGIRRRHAKKLMAQDAHADTNRINKELRLTHQFAALSCLWLVWLITAIYVVNREKQIHGPPNFARYADPFLVYSIVFVAIPLALVALGAVFEFRIGAGEDYRRFRRGLLLIWLVELLTIFGILVILGVSCFAALEALFVQKVRE